MYKPLPKDLTISPSKIQGLGVFTQFFIPKGTNFGMSHIKFGDTLLRTPLGGFLNHSNTPNCRKEEDGSGILYLITNQDIKAGEESSNNYGYHYWEFR